MKHIDPQQEIYSALLMALKEAGYDVYEGVNPPAGTPYPFLMLGHNKQTDSPTKTAILGQVNQKIHVWSNDQRQRGTHSSIMAEVKAICRGIRHTHNFSWKILKMESETITDDTTSEVLLHGIIDIRFHFS